MGELLRRSSVKTLTIANGGTTSTTLDARQFAMFGLAVPAAFTGTAISFLVSNVSGGTFQALYDSLGVVVSMAVTQGRSYDLPSALAAWPFIQIVSNGAEGGARTLLVMGKG